jgi:hypothetical protein
MMGVSEPTETVFADIAATTDYQIATVKEVWEGGFNNASRTQQMISQRFESLGFDASHIGRQEDICVCDEPIRRACSNDINSPWEHTNGVITRHWARPRQKEHAR